MFGLELSFIWAGIIAFAVLVYVISTVSILAWEFCSQPPRPKRSAT